MSYRVNPFTSKLDDVGEGLSALTEAEADAFYVRRDGTNTHTQGVIRVSPAGVETYYPPSADTNAARGTALITAQTAAISGDVILVGAGTYTITTSLGKNGVNYYFEVGSTVNSTTVNIFSDGGSAISFNVDGFGTFTNSSATVNMMNVLRLTAGSTVKMQFQSATASTGAAFYLSHASASAKVHFFDTVTSSDGTFDIGSGGTYVLSGYKAISTGSQVFDISAGTVTSHIRHLEASAAIVSETDAGGTVNIYNAHLVDNGAMGIALDGGGTTSLYNCTVFSGASPVLQVNGIVHNVSQGTAVYDTAWAMTSASLAVSTFTVTGLSTHSGFATFTKPPTGVTPATSTLSINPASATANADLLWIGVAGSAKFQVDEDGDVSIAATLDVNGASQFDGAVTVGVDATGHIVKFFGDVSGGYAKWDNNGTYDYFEIKGGDVLSGLFPYTLNLLSGGNLTYLGIGNSYGLNPDGGAFFGMSGTGILGDTFQLWNYQAGPIDFYTGPTVAEATVHFRLTNAGYVYGGSPPATPSNPNGWNAAAGSYWLGSYNAGGAAATVDVGIGFHDQTAAGHRGGDLWYDSSTKTVFIDSRYNNAAGLMSFRLLTNGTPLDALTITPNTTNGLIEFNAGNIDVNFEVNGDTDSMFWLDAGGGTSYFEQQVADSTTAFRFRDVAGNADFTYDSTNAEWESASGANYVMGGKITTYNNVLTEGYGVPAIVDNVALTAQVADITATNITNAGTAGVYRVNYVLECTTADVTAGTLTLTIAWTDGAGATTSTATRILTAVGRASGTVFLQLASGNVTYAVAVTGIYGTSQYALYISSERQN